jgi:hypothetical protein
MESMNKIIKFDFRKFSNKMLCIKALKDIFGFGLQEAKSIVDSGVYRHDLRNFSDRDEAINFYDSVCHQFIDTVRESPLDGIKFIWINSNSQNIQEINNNVVKVGSVYILTEEEYNHLHKCHSLLMDMLGTYKQFLQAYESFK